MPRIIDWEELEDILIAAMNAYAINDPLIYGFLATLHDTGLRVNEVMEIERWKSFSNPIFRVLLEKSDNVREVNIANVHQNVREIYLSQNINPIYTYSAIAHRLKRALPIITINGDSRPTVTHLFRYKLMKSLYYESGLTVSQVQDYFCHKSRASTERYIFDQLILHD